MTPAKKKKKGSTVRRKKKPCPEPAAPPPPPPPPVLTEPQKKRWMLTTKANAMGTVLFVLGVGILVGHWFYHREWHTPSFVGSMVLMMFGALLVEPAKVKDAGGTLVGWAKDVIPGTKKNGSPPPGTP